MPIIYEPRGKAKEYADLAVNLFTGCRHACRYCYCPAILRKSLDDWAKEPSPRNNILKQLEREVAKFTDFDKEVLFSFMSDPYQDEFAAGFTREAVKMCGEAGIRMRLLTKNGLLPRTDFAMFKQYDLALGSTIIFDDETFREHWEPGASPLAERVEMLRLAKEEGIRTWASIEPVIDPIQGLRVIRDLSEFVDVLKIGRWNHDARANEIDWYGFLKDTMTILKDAPCSYYIKKDLWTFADDAVKAIGSQSRT